MLVDATVDCTFTNRERGNIVVVKQTQPAGSSQSFTFSTSYGPDFALTDGQSNDSGGLTVGAYSVSESVPAGWKLESATCDDGSDPANIGLDVGETVTCTFINSTGAILISKTTKNASAEGGVSPLAGVTFEVRDSGDLLVATVVTDANGQACVGNLVVGDSYTITETSAPAGYDAGSVAPQVVVATAAECGPPISGTPADAPFVNNPLSQIMITFESLAGDGVTVVTSVVCTGPSADGSELGELNDGESHVLTDLLEGTYTCVIVVDP